MAVFTTNAPVHRAARPSFFERFDTFFTGLSRARACGAEHQGLAGLSDVQLAARGMERSDIVRHVARAYL